MRLLTLYPFVGSLFLLGCGAENVPDHCSAQIEGERIVLMTSLDPNGVDSDPALRHCIDMNAASRRDATAQSPGQDESYGMSQSGVIPWTAVTYDDAVLACARAGKYICSPRLYGLMGQPASTLVDRWVGALSPTEDYTVKNQYNEIGGHPDLVAPVPYPDSTTGLSYWATGRKIVGLIDGELSSSNSDQSVSMPTVDYKHPMLGFRCCIDARLHELFGPLPADANHILSAAPMVPITTPTTGPTTVTETCGDGTIDINTGESCDDGNRVSGDGCDALCRTESGADKPYKKQDLKGASCRSLTGGNATSMGVWFILIGLFTIFTCRKRRTI